MIQLMMASRKSVYTRNGSLLGGAGGGDGGDGTDSGGGGEGGGAGGKGGGGGGDGGGGEGMTTHAFGGPSFSSAA